MHAVAQTDDIDTPSHLRYRGFYAATATFAIAVSLIGFAPTYYLKLLYGSPPLTLLVHLHGLVFTSWLLLFFVQTQLVARHRIDLHRRLGVAGVALAVMMMVVGTRTAITAAAVGHAPNNVPPLMFLAIPLFALVLFGGLLGAGLYLRRRNHEAHKRLMLLATLSLLSPPIARLPLGWIREFGVLAVFGITDVMLLTCIAIDTFRHRRLHPAMLWGSLAFIASQPVRLLIARSETWHEVALWLTSS